MQNLYQETKIQNKQEKYILKTLSQHKISLFSMFDVLALYQSFEESNCFLVWEDYDN